MRERKVWETLVLRQAALTTADDINALLQTAAVPQGSPLADSVLRGVRPEPAQPVRPWTRGYERALELRQTLGWGDEPAPDLAAWMLAHNINVQGPRLPRQVDVVACRTEDGRAVAAINSGSLSPVRLETGLAAALGHILMDPDGVAVDGEAEHWPSAARARAFGVMLLLPEDGLRSMLGGRRSLDADAVREVMDRFKVGPYATTFHLRTLGFVSAERGEWLLQELVGRRGSAPV